MHARDIGTYYEFFILEVVPDVNLELSVISGELVWEVLDDIGILEFTAYDNEMNSKSLQCSKIKQVTNQTFIIREHRKVLCGFLGCW